MKKKQMYNNDAIKIVTYVILAIIVVIHVAVIAFVLHGCFSKPEPTEIKIQPSPMVHTSVTKKPTEETPRYSEDDLETLAQVMCYEAGGQEEDIILLVGCVIKNRVEHPWYPDNYYDVVTQNTKSAPTQYGILSETGPFWPAWTNDMPEYRDYCRDLAKMVLTEEVSCPSNVIFQAGFEQGNGIYKHIGDYYFCYE